ncbi:MAG: tyrosine-type recombinase/integrase [Halolamina sp.]
MSESDSDSDSDPGQGAATASDAEDPVEYFLEDMTYHGRTERTRRGYERVIRGFESFLSDPTRNPVGEPSSLGEATHRHCMAWVHSLRGRLAEGTVATYAANLHRFFDYMVQVGRFEDNPMALVMEEMDESIEKDPARRELGVADMRRLVGKTTHPLERALVVTLLKTGMRVGEAVNLDLRDLSLSVDLDGYEGHSRPQLAGRPDSLYVPADPARGEAYNDEVREASNKRKRATVVPVDDELAAVLKAWLAVRPDARSPACPLFVGTAKKWGRRLRPDAVRHIVREHAEPLGWYRAGGDASENVTPHYFRHFFTTHLRERTGDRGVVKYLRGDVADDVIDTYTHNWGDSVRDAYERHVYSLL